MASMIGETPTSKTTTTTATPSHSLRGLKKNYATLFEECDKVLRNAARDMVEARELAERAGLTVYESLVDTTTDGGAPVLRTTGGHSNTDHVVVSTGDPKTDRIAELKRSFQRRVRAMQPENKGEDRWVSSKSTHSALRIINRCNGI